MIPLSRRGFEELEISVLEAGDHMWLSARSPQGSVFAVKRPLPEWKLPRDVTGRPVDEPGDCPVAVAKLCSEMLQFAATRSRGAHRRHLTPTRVGMSMSGSLPQIVVSLVARKRPALHRF